MASFRKVGKRWRVDLCVKNVRRSKTLATKREAVEWAVESEKELSRTPGEIVADKMFADILNRYAKEVSPTKLSGKREIGFIARFLEDEIAHIRLSDLSPADFASWRDRRLREVSGSTVQREMNVLSHVCNVARKEWGWLSVTPTSNVRRPKANPARNRVPTEDETDRMLFALGYESDECPITKSARVGWSFLFALETAMRAGEIAALAWVNVHERYVHVPKTKNGHARDVPLSLSASGLLEQIRPVTGDIDTVLDIPSSSIDALWRKARGRALVDDLHFHDSRRAALTRMAKVLSVMELAKVSGHRDLRVLQNVYYTPAVEDIADKLG